MLTRTSVLTRLVGASLSILALSACGGDEAPADQGPHAIVVNVATVRTGELRDVANASGTVVPSSVADVTIYATEPADIVELTKKAGDPVAPGDILVRFDIASLNQEIAAAQLGVLEAQTRVDRAQADLTRQTTLFERGIASRNTFDASRLEQSAAQTLLTLARNRLEAVQSGQVRAVVRAAFAGVVAEVWHQEGDAVRPDTSDPILRVIDPTRVQVAVQLPVVQLARVAVGQIATVRAIAGAADEPATVVSRAQSADPSAPTGEVRLGFSNPATLPLETPVSVEILLERRPDALLVPAQAIGRDDTGTFVMVAGHDGLAHRRAVRLGLITPQLVQVSSGLTDGEQVVVSQLGELADQASIVISR